MLAQPRNNQPGQQPSHPVGPQGMPPGAPSRPLGNNTRPPNANTRPPNPNTRPPGANTRPPTTNTRPPGNNTRPPNVDARPAGNNTRPPVAQSHPRTVSSASLEIIRAINPRRLIGVWLVAIVAAGALIFLFPRTLQEAPRSATTTASPTVAPTAAPESAAQAWGNQAIALFTLAGNATNFTPTDVAANFAAGYITLNGGGYSIATIALPTAIDPATPTAAPTPQTLCPPMQGIITPPTVITDGTYLAWIATTASGAGQITQTINYATLQPPSCNQVGTNTVKAGTPGVLALDQGLLVWQQAGDQQSLQIQDLAQPGSSSITIPLSKPLATKLSPAIQLVGSRLLYQATDGSIHVVNLSNTSAPIDTAYPAIKLSATPQIQLTPDGITWLAPISGHTTLKACHLTWAAPSKPSAIVTLPAAHVISHLAVASAVIAWDNGTAFQAWDATKHIFVALHAAPATGATLAAHGTLLWYLTDDPSLAIIDTTTLRG
jgi:hypothetical protein